MRQLLLTAPAHGHPFATTAALMASSKAELTASSAGFAFSLFASESVTHLLHALLQMPHVLAPT
jgi:hypothetical protein